MPLDRWPRIPEINVIDLPSAREAYREAKTHREHVAAIHEVMLFGGPNYGYCTNGKLRRWIVQSMRRLALWIEEYGW